MNKLDLYDVVRIEYSSDVFEYGLFEILSVIKFKNEQGATDYKFEITKDFGSTNVTAYEDELILVCKHGDRKDIGRNI